MADAEGATLTAAAVENLADQLHELDHEPACEIQDTLGVPCEDPARWWLRGRAHCSSSHGGDSLMCDHHYGAVLRGVQMRCPGCGEWITVWQYVVEVRSL